MKMLTIEEFHLLHNAFRQVDNDRDHFLTRDEIRTTLNYLFELTEYDIKEIISVFDTNQDDRISLEEYIGRKIFALGYARLEYMLVQKRWSIVSCMTSLGKKSN